MLKERDQAIPRDRVEVRPEVCIDYRTCVLLPYATISRTLQAKGVRIEKLPTSENELPSSVPLSSSIGVREILGAVMMSVETRVSPVFFRPEVGEGQKHNVKPICVLGDKPLVFERFCESLSLAVDDHVRHKWMWPDYGDALAFGFREAWARSGSNDAGYSWPKVRLSQKILNDTLKIHRMRNRCGQDAGRLETSIGRWVKSKDGTPLTSLEDRFIELRIALEALYLDNDQGELGFRLATNGAWDLGSTFSQREAYHELLRETYHLSSRAIHGGSVKSTEANRKLLREAQAACRTGILRQLKRPGSPDWRRIVLGDKRKGSSE